MKVKKAVASVIAGISVTIGCLSLSQINAVNAATNSVTNEQINQYVKDASLEQKVGQMYVSRTPQDPNQVRNDVSKYNLGGLIVYDADMTGLTQQQFKDKMQSFQDSAQMPLLVGVDQEGGLVSRLTHSGLVPQNGDQFAFPRKQYEDGGMQEVVNDATKNATLLRSLGINWNYAPDADYSTQPGTFMWDRTFGQGYQQTADYLSQAIPAWQHDNLVAATLKHFPGYGDAADTHTGFAENNKSLADLEKEDMLPFIAGMNAGADSVMVTHVIYNNIDSEYPASLSAKVNALIRNYCHYNGLIVTDALEMGAITDFAKAHNNIPVDVLAVKAGNDMIMTSDYATGIGQIVKAVKAGEIPESQIDASVTRILQMKNKLGLLKPEDLVAKKPTDNKNKITINSVTYDNSRKIATIKGAVSNLAAEKTMIMSAMTATGKIITSTKVEKSGSFTFNIPMTNSIQTIKVVSDDDTYSPVTTTINSINNGKVDGTITLTNVTYNNNKKVAFINGKVSDPAAEGSMIMSAVDSKTGKDINTAVVGGKGIFSIEVPLTNSVQKIKIVSDDKSYIPVIATVNALKSNENDSSTNTTPNENANTSNNSINKVEETKMSGTVYVPVINNNVNWQVALLDCNGKFTGKYINTNSNWRVFAEKVINGTTYYRLGSQVQWIPAKYANNESNKEVSVQSNAYVPVIKHNKNYKVALLDANGKYTGQFISTNSNWKVLAIKVINGEKMLRLGTQKQWVPMKYTNFNI